MGKALMYLVKRASSLKVDGFIIVQSAKADRIYIERNLLILKAVFGAAAPKRTIILVTKAEDVLDDSPMGKRKRALVSTRMEECARIASIYGAAKPIFWFNNFDEKEDGDYLYAAALMKQIGLREIDIKYYLPYWRREFQRIYDSLTVYDDFPNRLKHCIARITKSANRAFAVKHSYTIESTPAEKETTPGYWEEYYDPSVGSMMGSIFSFGISAACGANMSKRWVPAEHRYLSSVRRFTHTFVCVPGQESYGVNMGVVTGDGSLYYCEQIGTNKIIVELLSTGPVPPKVTLTCYMDDYGNENKVQAAIANAFEHSMMKKEKNGRRVFRTLDEIEATVHSKF